MAATKAARAPAPAAATADLHVDWSRSPLTTEDCLLRIRMLGQRIGAYVEFMCTTGQLGGGTSLEAKHKGVADFYERIVIVERQLARIHDELRLG